MRKLILLFAVLFITASRAYPQNPSAEIFGGYSYLNFSDINNGESFNGWAASVSGNLNRNLGFVADFSGSYKTFGVDIEDEAVEGASVNIHNFLFGPRFSVRRERATVFGHLLLGSSRIRISLSGGGVIGVPRGSAASSRGLTDTGFALGIGGGIDVNATNNFAIRVAQLDYLPSRHRRRWHQDFRYLGGVVFKF